MVQPQRDEYLAQACLGDASLQHEVESLLRYESDAAVMTVLPLLPALSESNGAIHGQRIGAYKIKHEIAHGGMGAVYLATRADDQYRSKVAIKIIRHGMDSNSVLSRFRTERQILAALNHPNIARLLDGGQTAEGLPYLVMEYVEGQPLDIYVRTNRLTLRERLVLFCQICAAVQYAHQHLVVHRDLKPSNILVTSNGAPKLLDFGIAKFLAPEFSAQILDPTTPTMRLLTPAYASPEQVKGETVTTASDVYSLGVLLYELLTGDLPYRVNRELPQDLMRSIIEDEPERPSKRSEFTSEKSERSKQVAVASPRNYRLPVNLLKDDLDNIVLMALRKEPLRRYSSVAQFSEDIRRYLAGLPVSARHDTLGYRLQKFVARHRIGVAAITAILLSLLAGFGLTLRAQRQSERRFAEVRALAHQVIFDYQNQLATVGGATLLRQRMIQDAVAYLDKLSGEASGDSSLQQELAAAYVQIGRVQGGVYEANLGDTASAAQSFQKAITLLEANTESNNTELSEAYEQLGRLRSQSADYAEGLALQRKALVLRTQLLTANPQDSALQRLLIGSHKNIGEAIEIIIHRSGDTRQRIEARTSYEQARDLSNALLATPEATDKDRYQAATIHQMLGFCLYNIAYEADEPQRYQVALTSHQQALAEIRRLAESHPENARYRRAIADSLMDVGRVQIKTNNLTESLANLQEAISIFKKLAAQDLANLNARWDLRFV